jgi:hypothetical protein
MGVPKSWFLFFFILFWVWSMARNESGKQDVVDKMRHELCILTVCLSLIAVQVEKSKGKRNTRNNILNF